MTAIQTRTNTDGAFSPDKPITAKMTPGQWLGVVGAIIMAAGFFYATLARLETSINDAARDAKSASQDAAKALDQSNAVKAELQGALVNLSSKLGRIEGLLERLTQEPRK